MDFLDSLDLQSPTHDKKTERVRSWYLYEQYKTLELHQLEAAQQLRNRSMQDRLLQRELTERRARRSFFDQVSFTRSEPCGNQSQATCLSTTADDFYETFCEVHDFEANSLDRSHRGSDTFMDDYKTIEFQEDTSCADTRSVVSSVVDVEREPTNESSGQRTLTENIKQHLLTVKENIVSLEKYAQMADEISEDSIDSLGWPKPNNVLRKKADDNQLFCIWSRLVAFAYHIIQLNHGNCCYDYSSQVLTAVLACDALRRGVNRMCDILQYYVSPIKFNNDFEDSITARKKNKKKSYVSKKIRKSYKYKLNASLHKKSFTKRSEGYHHSCCKMVSNKTEETKGSQLSSREWLRLQPASASRTLWPDDLLDDSVPSRRAVNPMLQLVRHLDDIQKANMDFKYT